jgi:hypothetical protein
LPEHITIPDGDPGLPDVADMFERVPSSLELITCVLDISRL